MMPSAVRQKIGRQPHAQEAGRQIDEEEGKDRDQPQHQKIIEGVPGEARLHGPDARPPGPGPQEIGQGRSRRQEDDGRPDGGCDHDQTAARPGPEQEAAGQGHRSGARNGEGHDQDIKRAENQGGQHRMALDPGLQRGAMGLQRLQRQLMLQPQGEEERETGHQRRQRQETAPPAPGLTFEIPRNHACHICFPLRATSAPSY